jgi:superfamily I DNA and/or RNA helicase
LEPAAWIPISKGNKVVLAGDPFQLPPTVKSREAQRSGLEVTLMEKCISRLQRVNLLRTQYRMNTGIMTFSNAWFYGGQLEAHASVADHALRAHEPHHLPVEFVDTAGCGFEELHPEEGTSLENPGEARIVLEHLRRLSENLLPDAQYSCAIISPYKAQVEHLRAAAKSLGDLPGISSVDVNTIDSFQGQERDIVYLSLVRSNERSEIGFLSDYRRMNVAMTRARMKLVMVGDSATIGNNEFYGGVIRHAEQGAGYVSAWEYMG